jgi:hypothetical protein
MIIRICTNRFKPLIGAFFCKYEEMVFPVVNESNIPRMNNKLAIKRSKPSSKVFVLFDSINSSLDP